MQLKPDSIVYSVRVTADEAGLLSRVIAYVQQQDAQHSAFTDDAHNTFKLLVRDFYFATGAGE